MKYAYQKIAEDLLRRIRQGEWENGKQIPPIRVLEKEYPQSQMTLYKALRYLADRGYITMARRRGTFVKAADLRERVALLTRSDVFQYAGMPFAWQAFRHAQAFFARAGMDSQLYAEDDMSESGLPVGLLQELERRQLAGLLSVDARFPVRFMRTDAWKRMAVPVVNVGAYRSPHIVYVDREAFFRQAVAQAVAQGCGQLALVERSEHMADHFVWFRKSCDRAGVRFCVHPAHMPAPDLGYEEYGFDLMQRLWRATPRPDAVLVPDDVMAKGVAQAALALRVSVPDELRILAMTNSGARFFYPVPVTRFEVDVEAIAVRAARMLMDMISGREVLPQAVLIPPMEPSEAESTATGSPVGLSGRNEGERDPATTERTCLS
jgi:DNA-binding LacI/PurR family transcriptional regulator